MVSILDRFGRLKSDMCLCQIVIGIYRLSVLHNSMDSLQSMGPGSLNSSGDKALFYIFHILPEWLGVALLFISNTRQMFDTGLMGDWRYHDETPQESEKRLKGEAKHREKLNLQMLPPAPAMIRHSIS